MRESLKQSLADSPVENFEKYPKGSIVVCNACAKPIFILDRAICLGDKVGQSASAYKPLSLVDLGELGAREDVDAGIRAMVRAMTMDDRRAHVALLTEVRTGEPMLCPCCKDCFVQVLELDSHAVLDKSYVIELLTIPPFGAGKPAPLRGRRIGASRAWLHEGQKTVN